MFSKLHQVTTDFGPTLLLIHSSPSWEANRFSAGQEIPPHFM